MSLHGLHRASWISMGQQCSMFGFRLAHPTICAWTRARCVQSPFGQMNSKMAVCTRKQGVGVKTGDGRENQNMYVKMCANGREKTMNVREKTWKSWKPRYGRENGGVYVKAPCGRKNPFSCTWALCTRFLCTDGPPGSQCPLIRPLLCTGSACQLFQTWFCLLLDERLLANWELRLCRTSISALSRVVLPLPVRPRTSPSWKRDLCDQNSQLPPLVSLPLPTASILSSSSSLRADLSSLDFQTRNCSESRDPRNKGLIRPY